MNVKIEKTNFIHLIAKVVYKYWLHKPSNIESISTFVYKYIADVLSTVVIAKLINPLVTDPLYSVCMAKILILKKGSSKIFPMSVSLMSL